MFSVSRALMGFGALLTTSGIGFWTAYETTKTTISDSLDGKRIIFGNRGSSELAWEKLLTKLKNGEYSKKFRSDEFKFLDLTILEPKKDFSKLKDFCLNTSIKTYKTLISSNDNLLQDVKDFCTIKIKEVFEQLEEFYLKTEKNDRENDKAIFISNLKTLKTSHDENKYGSLVKELQELRSNLPRDFETDNESWKLLANWCDRSYKLTFLHEYEPVVKQTNIYCQRPKT